MGTEFALVAGTLLSGLLLARLVGFGDWKIGAPMAIAAGALLKLAAFSITVILPGIDFAPVWGLLVVVVAVVSALRHRFDRDLIFALATLAGFWFLAWILLRQPFFGLIAHSDSIDMLFLAEVGLESSGFPSTMKRGLLMPLLMMNPLGEDFLAMAIPLTAISAVWSLGLVLRAFNPSPKFRGLPWVSLAVVAGTPIVASTVLYAQSHSILALAMALGGVAWQAKGGQNPNAIWGQLVVLSLVSSLSRPEGFLYATFLIAWFLQSNRVDGGRRIARWLLITPAWVMLSRWSLAPDTPAPIPLTAAVLVLGVGSILVVVIPKKPFLWLLDRVWVAPILMLAATPIYSVLFEEYPVSAYVESAGTQIYNLFILQGGWGILPLWALAGAIIFIESQDPKARGRLFGWLLGAVALTVSAKFLDGPSLGRMGFTDSISRSWLHLLPLWGILAMHAVKEVTFQFSRLFESGRIS